MVIACLPTRRCSCLTCCPSSRTREADTTSSPAATAVFPPRSTSLIPLRRTAAWTSSSRDNSAIVFSPELIRPTVSSLNSAENTRRPSEHRGNSPISHQPFRSHHRLQKVSSRNGEQSSSRRTGAIRTAQPPFPEAQGIAPDPHHHHGINSSVRCPAK
jgi:hypothetical protein